MLVIKILLSILFIIIVALFKNTIKNRKNIGQKIGFLYNDIYKIMISDFYNKSFIKKNELKLEILSYYDNVLLEKNIMKKYKKLLGFKSFIENYYGLNYLKIARLLSSIEDYTNNYYKLFTNNIVILLFMIILLLLTILLIIKIY